MDGGGAIFLFLLLLGLGIVFRLAAGHMDRVRIEEYVRNRGGCVTSIEWEPFGPGWFGEKSDRIYRVCFQDRRDRRHVAYCKTSSTTGVYFTLDEASETGWSHDADESAEVGDQELLAENRRLRGELERLRRRDA